MWALAAFGVSSATDLFSMEILRRSVFLLVFYRKRGSALIKDLLIYLVSGMGLLTVIVTAANCIFNYYAYTKTAKYIWTGIFLGLCSLVFNVFYFSVNGTAVFDMKFMLIILLAICFNNKVLAAFIPLYLIGEFLETFPLLMPARFPMWSVAIAVVLVFVAYILGLLKIRREYIAALLFLAIVPIAFSEIHIFGYLSDYVSKMFLVVSIASVVFLLLFFIIFFAFLGRNFLGSVYLRTYIINVFSKLNYIYTFKINRARTQVSVTQRCMEEIEFPSKTMSYVEFEEIIDKCSNHSFAVVNHRVEKALFITPSTGREMYVEYCCHRRLFGGCKGFIYDVTDKTPRYEILSQTSVMDYVTGFPPYIRNRGRNPRPSARRAATGWRRRLRR